MRLLVVSGSLAVATAACDAQAPPAKKAVRPVRVHKVVLGSGANQRTFTGTAKAGLESNLSFKVGGLVSRVLVKVGDRVRKGQVIATMDDKDYRLQLKQVQASYAQARAQARNAKAEYERTRRLYENRSVSIKDLDNARASADSARAQSAAQAQAVGLARSKLEYCTLRAPAPGEIAQVPVNDNENVQPGQVVATLNSGSLPEVQFDVPESMIGAINKGDAATVTLTALAGLKLRATVTEVGVAAGATAYPVTVRLNQPNAKVRPGMAAEVMLAMKAEERALSDKIFVPPRTVLEDSKGRFVFVALGKPGGQATVERRSVRTGAIAQHGLTVEEGLKVGDFVVSAGLRFVEPGTKVRILAQ